MFMFYHLSFQFSFNFFSFNYECLKLGKLPPEAHNKMVLDLLNNFSTHKHSIRLLINKRS